MADSTAMQLGRLHYRFLGPTLLGMAFGLLLEKSKVFEPQIIQQQMLLENFTMMKVFLSAAASGMVVCSMLSMFHGRAVRSTMSWYAASMTDQHYIGSIIGGLLIGSGISCAGACPITLFVQLGSGVPNVGWAVLGAYCGTLLFDMAAKPLTARFLRPCYKSLRQVYLYPCGVTPYFDVALPMAAILATATFSLEIWKPWKNGYLGRDGGGGSGWLSAPAWPPYIVGVLISMLYIPLVGWFYKIITNSEVFTVINDAVIDTVKTRQLPAVFSNKVSSKFFFMFFSFGITLGAYISSHASNSHQYGVATSYQAFSGALLAFLGSKIAAGCCIGHGISGVILLSKLSLVVLPALWIGGYITVSFLLTTDDHL